MCGIVGIAVKSGRIAPEILERATTSLAHRGPDDSGTILIQSASPEPVEIGLGNRRLAILDLSPSGHQPMQDPETGNWIAFNGEIYNFRAVRKQLEASGDRFRSQSDTEVLLKAYARWGESCLDRLRGMFAFAIWDAHRRRLFIARDPMGIKPLYYAAAGNTFVFGSELRTVLGTGILPRRLDRAGLLNYLAFGSLYDPISLVEGVSSLRPGHYLTWEGGTVREIRYWDITCNPAVPSEADRLKRETEVHVILDDSVRMQMVSDVPVGIFLSGGIDSSALAAILSQNGGHISTFSMVFREDDFTEAEFSRLVARKFGTDHHEILVSQNDALEAIPGALRAMDQPSIDGLNTYLISRQTRAAGIKVALSGLGGDEVFAGYSTFETVPQMEKFAGLWGHLPSIVRQPLARVFDMTSADTDRNRKLAALAEGNGDVLHPYFLARALFSEDLRRQLLVDHDRFADRASEPLRDALSRARDLDPINRVSYLEARCYMLNTLLRDADSMSMAHGLEIRVPLIDHRLAEGALALPGEWKLPGTSPKPLLVSALHGALPDEIVHRRKQGFTLPFEHWLKDELRKEIETGLSRIQHGPLGTVLNEKAIQRVWSDFLEGKTSWSRPWSLYVLQQWCEMNSVNA